jgi:hypothetical protein
MQRLAIVPIDAIENAALREAALGTLKTARKLGLLPDDEFEDIANTTVERMTADQLAVLARLSMKVCELLTRASSTRRRHSSIIVRSK